MLKSYILIALRRLSHDRTYVSINILSLALGIGSFLVLALYLRSELSYDRHHAGHERIYRVISRFMSDDGHESHWAATQTELGPLLTRDFPQLGESVRFVQLARKEAPVILRHEDIQYPWARVYITDANAFKIFTHRIIYGDPATAFDNPYSIAISERVARHYFGDENPIGRTLSHGTLSYAVRLVFAEFPENTHLKYDALLPMSLLRVLKPEINSSRENLWLVWNNYTYLHVPPQFDPGTFRQIIGKFYQTYMESGSASLRLTFTAELQALQDIHFGEKLDGDEPGGSLFYLYAFAAIAAFILLVACINYINLATARALSVTKEVGMRQVLGASRSQLIGQFLGESFTFSVIATLLALALVVVALALTPIGEIMGKQELLRALIEPGVLAGIVLLTGVVALLSGLYPAFYLSAISPLAALTQARKSWRTGFALRQVLVIVQLGVSIGVIACTMLMTAQMRYVERLPLGFDKKNRLIVTLRGEDVIRNTRTIKQQLRAQPNIIDVTTIDITPGTGHNVNVIQAETASGGMQPVKMNRLRVGMNFVEGLNVKVVQGRGFSEDIATDAREAVMVNESFVRNMGWEAPLGKRIGNARVIGVVRDFHYASLHNVIGPLLIQPLEDPHDAGTAENQNSLLTASMIVVMSGEDISASLQRVHDVIAQFDRQFLFEPVFLEDELNSLYSSESSLMKLTGTFAGICIFISIMGLFGLAAYSTEQRAREIGIRKVLGSSDLQILTLLNQHLLPLIAIAAIPASLVSYYAIDNWLQRFAYRVPVSGLTFVLAIAIVTLVATITIALQAVKTTQANPVDVLRHE